MVASADGRRTVVFSGDHVKVGIMLAMCICGRILWIFFWLAALSFINSAMDSKI